MMDLYRFYAADERLLYVGISLSAAARASQHSREKPWWPDVARMDVEHHDVDRLTMEAIEREAIVAERPLHNVTHNATVRPESPKLVWTCAVCLEPIADTEGYIEMPTSERIDRKSVV